MALWLSGPRKASISCMNILWWGELQPDWQHRTEQESMGRDTALPENERWSRDGSRLQSGLHSNCGWVPGLSTLTLSPWMPARGNPFSFLNWAVSVILQACFQNKRPVCASEVSEDDLCLYYHTWASHSSSYWGLVFLRLMLIHCDTLIRLAWMEINSVIWLTSI